MMSPKESQYYTKGILDGNKRILSRTITLIESSLEQHRVLSKKKKKTGSPLDVDPCGGRA